MSLTFTTANWAAPQSVTVTGVGTAILDGSSTITVSINDALSADEFDSLADQAVTVHSFDLGDAPSPYPTLIADDGARHEATGPRLGADLDAESDGVPSADALGDDNAGSDDEDGVAFGFVGTGMTMAGVNIDLEGATTARVDAWLDFDGDGIWQNDEKILDNVLATDAASFETFNYNVNSDAIAGDTYARVRVSSTGNLDQTGTAADGEVEDVLVTIAPAATVVGRSISYGGSGPDGRYGVGAIDTSKSALQSGQASTANYSNYTAGLNRVVVDIQNRPDSELTTDDFEFRVGNTADPNGWTPLTDASALPTIAVTVGPGTDTDRVTLTWPDGQIKNTWLQVTVKATNKTGLETSDVFYFGNQVGDVFGSTTAGANTVVNATDVILTRFNQSLDPSDADIENEFDITKDGLVNAVDVILARFNQSLSDGLMMISV